MKILITGKDGLVGHALNKEKDHWYNHDFIFVGRNECDLTNANEVETLFKIVKPDWVIHTAAKVGGIGGNMSNPAQYFYDNILMNSHIIHYACKYNVSKLLAFSSVCVFPDNLPILKEELMHEGHPFHTQFAYGAAKRAIDTQITACKMQYNIKNYCSIIPCNIFGENDYYDINSGHVLPSLIHKLFIAKRNNEPLYVWGDGSPKREFIYSKDLALIIMEIIHKKDIPQRIIVSNNEEISIKNIVDILCEVANFNGPVIWQKDKPNGQLKRPSDLSILRSIIGDFKYTNINEAIRNSYTWFEDNFLTARKK